jgi:AcrR family transcriptional regulator
VAPRSSVHVSQLTPRPEQSRGRATHPPARRRRRPYHHGDTRNALLTEALAVIGERQTTAISLRDVARRVGLSHAAAYRHFPGKADLIAALATRGMYLLAESLEAASHQWDETTRRSRVRDPRRKVCRLGVAYVRFALDHPAWFRAMFAPDVAQKTDYPALRKASDAAAEPLLRDLGSLSEKGLLRAEYVRETAVSVWALVHGLAVLTLDGQLQEGRLHAKHRAGFADHLSIAWIGIARRLGLRTRPRRADLGSLV